MMFSDELLLFCREHQNEDVHTLALKANLYPTIDMKKALQQIKGIQIAKHKLPTWHRNEKIIYPPHLSLEQCSSEPTAKYKQQLCCKGSIMVDLTGGLGVDTSFLATSFNKVYYVEEQSHLVELAKHNFDVLGLNIETIGADAVEYLQSMNKVDLIYIDPARRNEKGGKTVLIEDCTPNLLDIQELLDEKADTTMIKLSPMLDITLALKSLTHISEVHIISVDNECKELLFIKNKCVAGTEPQIHCINITSVSVEKFSFLKSEEDQVIATFSDVETYLYEPNASIMKAGAYKSISLAHSLYKLHTNSHLYTSSSFVKDFPGRKFKVLTITSLNNKDLKKHLSSIDQANISTRNFPMKPEELRKKLKLKDGGDIYIFATTIKDNSKVLVICQRV